MNIAELPDEIILMIFRFLKITDIVNLKLVCSRFNFLIDSEQLWKKLCLRGNVGQNLNTLCFTFDHTLQIMIFHREKFGTLGILKIFTRKVRCGNDLLTVGKSSISVKFFQFYTNFDIYSVGGKEICPITVV